MYCNSIAANCPPASCRAMLPFDVNTKLPVATAASFAPSADEATDSQLLLLSRGVQVKPESVEV